LARKRCRTMRNFVMGARYRPPVNPVSLPCCCDVNEVIFVLK